MEAKRGEVERKGKMDGNNSRERRKGGRSEREEEMK